MSDVLAPSPTETTSTGETEELLYSRYASVRDFTLALCKPLRTEDYVVQSMEDVSPTKWHLAHTTWFWETFVLREHVEGYELFHDQYPYLFNSYYVQAGERHCRDQRGYLSRPTVEEVLAYRDHVDRAMDTFLAELDEEAEPDRADLIEIGLNHEQQHQELMLTDIKHVFSVNPLRPAYRQTTPTPAEAPGPMQWIDFNGGVVNIGFDPKSAKNSREQFHFDNEGPKHRQFLEPFALSNRLITNGDVIRFIEDEGYKRPELWLDAGWQAVSENNWKEPFYWEPKDGGAYEHFTLLGMRDVDPNEPACHLSYFEADAIARWMGARLPTEFEWEEASRSVWNGKGKPPGSFVESEAFHPLSGGQGVPSLLEQPGGDGSGTYPRLRQMFGEVWQWTQSHYSPYPGYRPVEGAIGEYNGKWMCGAFVLRGGSVATHSSHIRPTYRNFFSPESTWQFSGARLAKSLDV